LTPAGGRATKAAVAETAAAAELGGFLKHLGYPALRVHAPFNHFDFARASRRILVIGPMGSGKTEYSARVWRDSRVALKKGPEAAARTRTGTADRRRVLFVRSQLDRGRFPDYPADALAYRGGYERCGDHIAEIRSSFDLEAALRDHPDVGTCIVDEAAFYDERLAYVVRRESTARGLIFIFPTLILNFRREIFNATARLLLETATDVFPLTAYCEQADCLADSFYTYRYYGVGGRECPALYFDPLIIIGGDREKRDPREPDYCTRCDLHHYLPGKEYTFLVLKPLGEEASRGRLGPLREELALLAGARERSALHGHLHERYPGPEGEIMRNALLVPCIAEKALIYLYAEQNLLSREQAAELTRELTLDAEYIGRRLQDNGRPPL
jgi:thymidine kinase